MEQILCTILAIAFVLFTLVMAVKAAADLGSLASKIGVCKIPPSLTSKKELAGMVIISSIMYTLETMIYMSQGDRATPLFIIGIGALLSTIGVASAIHDLKKQK